MKELNETPVLELVVQTDPAATVEMDCEIGRVKMIPFNGTVDCENFKGIIEPCGVDTQVTNQAEVRHMSARYMLTGKDSDGEPCRIYIENNAYFTDGNAPRPWHSVPTFMTNSKKLAPILHRNQFVGIGMREERGLVIRYYIVKDAAK